VSGRPLCPSPVLLPACLSVWTERAVGSARGPANGEREGGRANGEAADHTDSQNSVRVVVSAAESHSHDVGIVRSAGRGPGGAVVSSRRCFPCPCRPSRCCTGLASTRNNAINRRVNANNATIAGSVSLTFASSTCAAASFSCSGAVGFSSGGERFTGVGRGEQR
jgi:hypothetical protein